ncbi:MAG: tRNA-dihydrouridine synthase [Planctomycetia bacterium]|nr:tRNA-dihydrouridine synthase [Planctomycetia bacterium]
MLCKPLKTGPLEFDFPVIQAALSGYSDAPMRRIARKFGASFALCEVFLDQFVMNVSKKSKSRLYLAVRDTDHPCGAQLMGSEPEEFVAAARRLLDFGFDLIDLNFACPVKKVLGRCRGGYLMSDPFQALSIAEKVRSALPDSVPLTVKLRKGFDDSPESREAFFELLDGLLDRGIAGITLHGRTVLQRYTGTSDWDFVRSVKKYLVEEKKRPDIPLIGSGDLFSAEICLKRYQESGVDGLALARGIIGNPWLFKEVRAVFEGKDLPDSPSLSEQKEVILDHYRQIEDLYGEKRASTIMRKFGVQYAQRHPRSEEVRRAFVFCKNTKMWIDVLNQFYEEKIPTISDQKMETKK